MSRLQALLGRFQAGKPWRAWSRYGSARGNVLAGGIAYIGFIALVPTLAVGFAVFGLVVRSDDLQVRVADYVNTSFGSVLIGTPSHAGGLVSIDKLVQTNVIGLTGAIGLVTLLVTGLGWVDSMRQGIRAMYGLPDQGNPVLLKLWDVAVLAVVGLSVIASFVVSVLLSAATGAVLGWLGVGSSGPLRFVVPFVIDVALLGFDVLLFLMFFRVLAQVRGPIVDQLGGALLGAIGLFALKQGGGLLLRVGWSNLVSAALVTLVGLLLWLNLVGRLTLISASWAATTAADRAAADRAAVAGDPEPSPDAAAASGATGFQPSYGQRAADRTVIIAGAVLGATTVVGLTLLARAGRTAQHAVRRSFGTAPD